MGTDIPKKQSVIGLW